MTSPRTRLPIVPGLEGRLDIVARRLLPAMSRRVLHALIVDGEITVNGRPAAKGTRLTAGDVVEAPVLGGLVPEADAPLVVLYEDAELVAVDKPGGVPGHALDPRQRGTVAAALLARYPELATVGDPLATGFVHRLDTGTSGVLLAARTRAAYASLREAFRHRRVVKRYTAIVVGVPAAHTSIDTPLAHDSVDRGRMRAARPGDRSWSTRSWRSACGPA